MVFDFFVLLTTSVELQMSDILLYVMAVSWRHGKIISIFMVSSDMHERKISCCICGVAWWRLDSRKKLSHLRCQFRNDSPLSTARSRGWDVVGGASHGPGL